MFKIGDFARLSRVPVKTLRYYDEIGLLKPVRIDRFTRYRYYSVEQLPRLNRILVLKELGFSLEQVGRLLQDSLSPEQVKGMLRLRQAEIEQQLQAGQAQLNRLATRLEQIEREGRMTPYEVVIRKAQRLWVVGVEGNIPSYDESEPVFDRLFDTVFCTMKDAGVRPSGPGIAVYHESDGEGASRVEAAMPVAQRVRVPAPLLCHQLPAVEQMACVIHRGSFTTIGQAYQAMLAYIQSGGWRTAGPTREIYLKYTRGGDQAQYITEVQFPLEPLVQPAPFAEPRIVTRPGFLVAGLRYLGKNEHDEIGGLWDRFLPRLAELIPLAEDDGASYGMCSPGPGGLIDYIAGLAVRTLEGLPEGMEGAAVPEQTYAVFDVPSLAQVHAAYDYIENRWLAASGWRAAEGPDFEFYPPTFRGPADALEIFFPVVK